MELEKLRRGDLVLLHDPRQAGMNGVHLVLDVGKHAASVVPAMQLESARCFAIFARQIVARYPGQQVELELLPVFSKTMNLDRPEPEPAAPPVAPTPREIRFVEVWLPGDRPGLGLRYPRSAEFPNGREVLYEPLRQETLNRNRGSVFAVDFELLDGVLQNVPGSRLLDPESVRDETWVAERTHKTTRAGGR